MQSSSEPPTNRDSGAVVVTGSSSGIGKASCQHLLARGYVVVGLDRAPSTIDSPRFRAVAGDVTEPSSHVTALEEAIHAGGLSGWVNNAGIDFSDNAETVTVDGLASVIGVNLTGLVLGCSTAVKHFLSEGAPGAIVNVSSVQAVLGFSDYLSYQASKGAVDSVTRQIASQYGSHGIRCNGIRPGVVMTEMSQLDLERSTEPDLLLRQWRGLSSLGRIGHPDEIAAVITFLLSKDASFVTGETINVDGGLVARAPEPTADESLEH